MEIIVPSVCFSVMSICMVYGMWLRTPRKPKNYVYTATLRCRDCGCTSHGWGTDQELATVAALNFHYHNGCSTKHYLIDYAVRKVG